jgi:type I restriction enzyme R subunit
MTSNFTFLSLEWPTLFESAQKIERLAMPDPRAACFYARRVLELAVLWLYEHDAAFKKAYDENLNALLHEESFRANVPTQVFHKVQAIRKQGNIAVHQHRPVNQYEALQIAKETWHVLYWLARTYTRRDPKQLANLEFDGALLQSPTAGTPAPQTVKQLQDLEAKLHEQDQALRKTSERMRFAETLIEERDKALKERDEALLGKDAVILRLLTEIESAKKANAKVIDTHDYDEAATRDLFIDLLLREAGWQHGKNLDAEYPVEGLKTLSGSGAIDYVLWGDDGRPLAIVEAKRTKRDANEGREQARRYADAIEKKHNVRPLIFYSNGYETWFWDDLRYPPREVAGFYTADELALNLQRRDTRENPGKQKINSEIVDRAYQHEAIRSVSEHFERRQRRALLVMATGSGKTRTIIALCELLQRANWVKRVLFLADRRALVKQAQNAFKRHLPNTATVNLLEEREDSDARVYLSTYPTMMNLIDERVEDDASRFGPGYFDLVIIDEAHRSVYQKYGAIFQYFDSLLVGLTATPKSEIDHNTFRLFELEDGVPTFAYELKDAVEQGYLVPPKAVSVPMKFLREGITYADLSDEERDEYESIDWGDGTGEIPEKIESSALNKWLFNESTVDEVLRDLMENGLKVQGGDRIGKTILFAANHNHAEFIYHRFNLHYPEHAGHFATVIDNYIEKSEQLIDDFTVKDKTPHIAISVDMLDTGIDVPEVLNLVFFKVVRSRVKFFQMIGRGTRLCPDLFGPGEDKEYFKIFDYCQNFEFFSVQPEGIESGEQASISSRIFKYRLELLDRLAHVSQEDEQIDTLRCSIADALHKEVASMNTHNFVVRPQRRLVDRFSKREAWDNLGSDAYAELSEKLAGLPSELAAEDENAKRFDILMLQLELALLNAEPAYERLADRVKDIAAELELKRSIPQVEAHLELILAIQSDEYWEGVTLPILDDAREHLRRLVRFIDKRNKKIIYTDFKDEKGLTQEVDLGPMGFSIGRALNLKLYRKKVEAFLRAHGDAPAIQKLRFNLPIAQADLTQLEALLLAAGGVPDALTLQQVLEDQPLGVFIRRLVGLDRQAASKAFAAFLSAGTYTATQIRFIDMVIEYLTKNGVMDPIYLYDAPFTAFNPNGVEGVFSPAQTEEIVTTILSVNAVAMIRNL